MNRSLALTLGLAWSLIGTNLRADSTPAELAAKAWAVADTVLARHVEPPTRQQMFLAGLRGLRAERKVVKTDHLATRVTELIGINQLAALIDETMSNSRVMGEDDENAFFRAMLAVVPGETSLLSSKERKVQESFQANLYVGVQVALGIDEKTKKPVFSQILEGGPAQNAGILPGDLIEAVDGVPTDGMALAKVVDRLRGEEGTSVVVKYYRPSTAKVFEKPLTRSRLPRETIVGLEQLSKKQWKIRLDGPAPIGYLRINEINGSTPFELRSYAEQLESGGARALILDLRELRSAAYHPTVLVADALLDGGRIGRVATADGEKIIEAQPDALFRGWPMVVLVGRTPSGEAAWLAHALQDNHRAKLLGTIVLAGPSDVEEMVTLPGGEWSLQMATGRLLRGDGSPILDATLLRGKEFKLEDSLKSVAPPNDPKYLEQTLDMARQYLEAELK